MATVGLLLAFLCTAAVGQQHVPGGNLLSVPKPAILGIAAKELGVREATGKNDGARVNTYQAAAGLQSGQPWCAAFISWVFKQAGYVSPRTGWSPALFPLPRQRKNPLPGMLFGIYYPELKRIAHCGFVETLRGDWISTIEGNTAAAGGRDGDGVYRKWRHQKSIHHYAEWRLPHD